MLNLLYHFIIIPPPLLGLSGAFCFFPWNWYVFRKAFAQLIVTLCTLYIYTMTFAFVYRTTDIYLSALSKLRDAAMISYQWINMNGIVCPSVHNQLYKHFSRARLEIENKTSTICFLLILKKSLKHYFLFGGSVTIIPNYPPILMSHWMPENDILEIQQTKIISILLLWTFQVQTEYLIIFFPFLIID